LPLLALPLLKTNIPLTPEAPELILRMLIIPLVVAVPSPLARVKEPPVFTVLRPA